MVEKWVLSWVCLNYAWNMNGLYMLMLKNMLRYKLKYEVIRRFYLITKFKELFEICFTQKRLYQEFKSQHNKNSRTKTNILKDTP